MAPPHARTRQMRSNPSVIEPPPAAPDGGRLLLLPGAGGALGGWPCSSNGDGRIVLLADAEPPARAEPGVPVGRLPCRADGVPCGVPSLGVPSLGVPRGVGLGVPCAYDERSCASIGDPGCDAPRPARPAREATMRCPAADSCGDAECGVWPPPPPPPPPGSTRPGVRARSFLPASAASLWSLASFGGKVGTLNGLGGPSARSLPMEPNSASGSRSGDESTCGGRHADQQRGERRRRRRRRAG
eukprot:486845-Prymnesium_polylepis.1